MREASLQPPPHAQPKPPSALQSAVAAQKADSVDKEEVKTPVNDTPKSQTKSTASGGARHTDTQTAGPSPTRRTISAGGKKKSAARMTAPVMMRMMYQRQRKQRRPMRVIVWRSKHCSWSFKT
jgi:hypothetical protein